MASPSNQHAADIHKLSKSTKTKLEELSPVSNERCIYSAPLQMRLSYQQHFTPRIVSIGPIHYGNKKLRANEHLKKRYLLEFCELTKVSLEECYKLILDGERRLRNCYTDVIGLNRENFVEMILVDAAFLLMILVYNAHGSLVSDTDLLFKNPKMIHEIRHDMLLLENQLPFFILDDLYKLSKLQSILNIRFNETTFVTIVARLFINNYHSPKVPEQGLPFVPKHILDLYRSCLIPENSISEKHEIETTKMPTTKKLYQAGVKIKVGSNKNIFDITFEDGILKIPPLFIHDLTEQLFRNLLAYELCHYPETHIFSDYFEMMRLLTLSLEDTELLVQNKVIKNGLSNAKRVSTLFQNISTGNIVNFKEFLYTDVIENLNKYYEHDWHHWKATLRDKFKAPWAICSFSAGVLLLVLTIVQTLFTILQVVLPK